jgi:hypothetical protein
MKIYLKKISTAISCVFFFQRKWKLCVGYIFLEFAGGLSMDGAFDYKIYCGQVIENYMTEGQKFICILKKSFINYLNLRYNFQFGGWVYPEGLKSIILSHPNRWSIYQHVVKNRKSFGFQWL